MTQAIACVSLFRVVGRGVPDPEEGDREVVPMQKRTKRTTIGRTKTARVSRRPMHPRLSRLLVGTALLAGAVAVASAARRATPSNMGKTP